MNNNQQIRKGMQVYDASNQAYGTVQDVFGDAIMVNGQRLSRNLIAKVEQGVIVLVPDVQELRVPVAEEQLQVGKREVSQGAVRVHKEVIQEQQNVPVELRRETAQVEKRDLPDRPVQAGDDVFREGTIEIPLKGEEAVTAKEAIVTGEVVIGKTQQVEQRQVSDTIRKERVQVEQAPLTDTTTNTQS